MQGAVPSRQGALGSQLPGQGVELAAGIGAWSQGFRGAARAGSEGDLAGVNPWAEGPSFGCWWHSVWPGTDLAPG